ncbi:MAG: carbon-nitrogen hydrolase family protein [Candidatus Binatia bacterium]
MRRRIVERFVAAVVQMSSGTDRTANLRRAEDLVRAAAGRGARLVVLPEVFAWRGIEVGDQHAAETVPGPTSETMSALARGLGIFLCMGSILEAVPGEARRYNTSYLVDPSGGVAARYRKIHLFDVDLPGRVAVRESATRLCGDAPVVAPTALASLGCSICYDLRFPELYRQLAQAGAEVLLVPSAFTFPTGAAHWEVLCRARAIENQCYLLAANQTGPSPHGHQDYGNSMIVDPWGTVIARAGDGEGIATAELDGAYLARVRRELPALTHRRL